LTTRWRSCHSMRPTPRVADRARPDGVGRGAPAHRPSHRRRPLSETCALMDSPSSHPPTRLSLNGPGLLRHPNLRNRPRIPLRTRLRTQPLYVGGLADASTPWTRFVTVATAQLQPVAQPPAGSVEGRCELVVCPEASQLWRLSWRSGSDRRPPVIGIWFSSVPDPIVVSGVAMTPAAPPSPC
jgi:hypothetical protein